MRIAQVCMPFLSVPPQKYGGVERMVSFLTEELVARDHDVTLFASGDSATRARLISACPTAAGEGPNAYVIYATLLGMVARYASEFDLIHFHLIHWMPFPFVRAVHPSALITFHMPFYESEGLGPAFREFTDLPMVSISNAQRATAPGLNWVSTVYYGMPEDLYELNLYPESYLAFIGRLDPYKGPHRAIDIALSAGLPLKIAGPIRNAAEQEYFDTVISPKLKKTHIEYVGELNDQGKQHFLGNARALLFPIEWPEPFGLVMVEAMACGTPVIAFDCGSAREVVTDGVSGFVVSDVNGAIQAIPRISQIDRKHCRAEFEKRFSVRRMCDDYIAVYQRLTGELPVPPLARSFLA